jgi:hypothetical protein
MEFPIIHMPSCSSSCTCMSTRRSTESRNLPPYASSPQHPYGLFPSSYPYTCVKSIPSRTFPLHPLNQISYSPPSAPPAPYSSPSSHPSPHPYSSSLPSITPNVPLSHPESVQSSRLGRRSVSVATAVNTAPLQTIPRSGNICGREQRTNLNHPLIPY